MEGSVKLLPDVSSTSPGPFGRTGFLSFGCAFSSNSTLWRSLLREVS